MSQATDVAVTGRSGNGHGEAVKCADRSKHLLLATAFARLSPMFGDLLLQRAFHPLKSYGTAESEDSAALTPEIICALQRIAGD